MTGLDCHFRYAEMYGVKSVQPDFSNTPPGCCIEMGSSPSVIHTKIKSTPKGAFYFGADDRTRTCTLARWNLNPMSLPIPPHPHILFYFSRDGLQQYRNPIRLPVAVPEIFCSLFAHKISTAATRSARFIRHWRRSHRFPIPPHPQIKSF